mmetsp:Transcript_2592/g.5374  ORF Transcript_2592/g.5374 Transcript_2592/m.5374 type:complete len:104 (-) Transcript_2592:53-364(-)
MPPSCRASVCRLLFLFDLAGRGDLQFCLHTASFALCLVGLDLEFLWNGGGGEEGIGMGGSLGIRTGERLDTVWGWGTPRQLLLLWKLVRLENPRVFVTPRWKT